MITPPDAPGHDTRTPNRLANETSPYLLQHRFNPVDWYPWGPEAFEAARARDVPILLSVGYSTCYWCHVMEREAFENEQVAEVMNEHLVCIKLDREERPDVDDIYMNALQLMSRGRGGWPLNVFLEPRTLKPFHGETYVPAPQFTRLVTDLHRVWTEQRGRIEQHADVVAGAVTQQIGTERDPARIGTPQPTAAVETLLRMHDRTHGGFGKAPKFPQPAYIDFLLAFRAGAGDQETVDAVDSAVRFTLSRMAQGGMFDQVGGGFHRYSTDEKWLVPHFEKMLYDNGQLLRTYAEAADTYDDDFFRRTAVRIGEYVLSEMTDPAGGFFSAQDAEVNRREGENYVWCLEQLAETLDKEDAAFIASVYGVDRGTNFQDPHHPQDQPVNVLYLPARPEQLASERGMEVDTFLERVDRINAALYEVRATRDQPGTDDKVLSGWNGMMIGGFAVAGVRLGIPRFVEAASRAAGFVLSTMKTDDGLLRSYRGGTAKIPAFFEDYALVAHGLIELHRAGADGNGAYLAAAIELVDAADTKFGDPQGGYYDTLEGQSDLFVRTRTLYDGAVPSGTSVMTNNLVDLFEITGDRRRLDRAVRCLIANSASVAEMPVAAVNLTRALTRVLLLDDAEIRDRLGAAPDAAAVPDPGQTTVKIFASVEEVIVGSGAPATFALRLQIDDGFHITAADPGPGGGDLVPLRVGLANGTGVNVFAEYPDGAVFGPGGNVRVYHGTVDLPIVLEREGDWSGTPTVMLTYQVCTETYCLQPTTVEIDVAITREGD